MINLDNAVIHHIYISEDHNFYGHHGKPAGKTPMIEVDQAVCEAEKALWVTDFIATKKIIKAKSLFSLKSTGTYVNFFGIENLKPPVFRRNVIISGIDLNRLIDNEFNLQGINFFGTQEAAPCYWMNGVVAEGAEEAMKGRGGLRARILTNGNLQKVQSLVE